MLENNVQDVILVWKCPHCSTPHLYALEIHRTHWMGACYVPATPLEFVRLFTCPTSGEDFQVTMRLMQPHGVDYEYINVAGTVETEIDLTKIPIITDFYKKHGLIKGMADHGVQAADLRVPPGGIEYNGLRIVGIYGL